MRALMALLFLVATQAGAQTWQFAEPTPAPIATHGVAALDGKLYSVGGTNSFDCCDVFTAPTFVYDPASGGWSHKRTMTVRRKNLAVAAADGRIFAIGGDNDFAHFTTNEAYDPASDSWAPRTPMPTPRAFGVAAVVNDVVYVIGGEGPTGLLATVQAYDPATDTWSTKAPMSRGRTRGHAVAVVEGLIYVCGGFDFAEGLLSSVEAYDPATDTWSSRASLPSPRSGAAAVLGGRIYVISGSSVLVYDPAGDSWSTGPSLNVARDTFQAAALDDTIYTVGGIVRSPSLAIVSTVESLAAAVPPEITTPGLVTAEATSASGASVTFSVSASAGETSVPVDCDPESGSIFPLGATTVTCSATASGLTATATFTVLVTDTQAPEIERLSSSRAVLWPPNHKMVPVTIEVVANDAVDRHPVAQIVSVSSNQDDDATGDGNTSGDWIVTGPLTVLLRAERSATAGDRIYSIVVDVADASGNHTAAVTTVTVPK